MATRSSILAWRIPGTEEPSGLPSMGSHRVRHDWATNTHFSWLTCLDVWQKPTQHCTGYILQLNKFYKKRALKFPFIKIMLPRPPTKFSLLDLIQNLRNQNLWGVGPWEMYFTTQTNTFLYTFFFYYLGTLCGLWDLSSPTRDWNGFLQQKRQVLTTDD